MAVKMDFTNFLQKSVSKSLSSGCSYLKDKILPPSSPPHSPLSIWYAWPEPLQKRICPFSLKKIFFGQRENPITPLQRPAWILTPANSGIFIFFFLSLYHLSFYCFYWVSRPLVLLECRTVSNWYTSSFTHLLVSCAWFPCFSGPHFHICKIKKIVSYWEDSREYNKMMEVITLHMINL